MSLPKICRTSFSHPQPTTRGSNPKSAKTSGSVVRPVLLAFDWRTKTSPRMESHHVWPRTFGPAHLPVGVS